MFYPELRLNIFFFLLIVSVPSDIFSQIESAKESETLTPPHSKIQAEGKASVLVVSGRPLNSYIDDTYLHKMESEDYRLDSCRFEGLTWDRISKFNVLVIIRLPHAGTESDYGYFKSAFPLLKTFLQEGGGIFWFYDFSYDVTHLAMNAFMKDHGFELINEFIEESDPANQFRQKAFRKLQFITTRQIVEHPTTKGIEEILVPGGTATGSFAVSPFQTNDDWKVLITGEDTAYSHHPHQHTRTIDTRPPMFAVLSAPHARMAVLPVMSTFTIQAGYHRIWESLVMERGNVYELLRNSIDWLADPSMASGNVGGFTGKRSESDDSSVCIFNAFPKELQTADRQVFRGLIGARSKLGDGKDSVEAMCRAARESDLNFLVFTEPMEKMTRPRWERLMGECVKQSWGNFVALAGFEGFYDGGFNNRGTRIVFSDKDWLMDSSYDKDGSINMAVMDMGPFLSGLAANAYVQSHTPEDMSPLYHWAKFYSSFGLYSYDREELIDDSADRYKVLLEDLYWVRPLVYHKMFCVTDVLATVKADTYKTFVVAPSIGEVAEAMYRQMQHRPFGNASFVSNGPVIQEFRITGDGMTVDPWETYWLWEAGQIGQVNIDVASESPITDVVVHRGGDVYWHFRPMSKQFVRSLPYVSEQGGHLWMEVTDKDGHRAYSWALMTRHNTWWTNQCADLQNPIQSGLWPAKRGDFAVRNEMRAQYGGLGNSFAGMLGPPVSIFDLIPDGLDAAYSGFNMDIAARIWIEGKSMTPPSISRFSFVHSTGSVAVQESRTDLSDDFTCVTRRVAVPCRRNSYNVAEVTQTITFLRDLTVSISRDGLPITLFTIYAGKDMFPNFSYNSGNEIKHLKRSNISASISAKLDAYGGVCFYPQYWGSGAVFAVDGRQYDARLTDGGVSFGLNSPGRKFRKGETLTAKFLVIRESGADPDDTGMRSLVTAYGVGNDPAYEIKASGLVSHALHPEITAGKQGVDIKISEAGLANDLFLRVNGLNPNWSAACYDRNTGKLNFLGVFENTAYVQVDTRRSNDLFVGNVLTCDSPHVRLTLVGSNSRWSKVLVHNLSGTPVSTVVKSAGARAGIPEFGRKVSLKPGEISTVIENPTQ